MTQPTPLPAKNTSDSPRTQRSSRKPGFTRRTHPRSARAHRRALRRAFREAIRRALSRRSIAMLTGVLMVGGAQAQDGGSPYVPVYKTEGGSAYVLLKSDNVVDNYLAIHFDAAENCNATLTMLDYYLGALDADQQSGWLQLDGLRFDTGLSAHMDGEPRGETEAVIRFDFDSTRDEPVGLLSVSFKADTGFIHDLQMHEQATLRYRDAEGDWTGSIAYSLAGAQREIGSAALHCEDRVAEVGMPVRVML